jgi:hypothetical protein
MNCKLCGCKLSRFYVHRLTISGGNYRVVCPNLNCEAFNISFGEEEYSEQRLDLFVEYHHAFYERMREGRVTPRFEAARARLQDYLKGGDVGLE